MDIIFLITLFIKTYISIKLLKVRKEEIKKN